MSINKKIDNYLDSSDKKVTILVIGTLIAQLITILLTPLLSRIYSPEDFGLFAIFFSITGILSTIIGGRYEIAIVQPKKMSESMTLAFISLSIMLLSTISLTLFYFLFKEKIFQLTNVDSNFLILIPLLTFFIGLFNILDMLNTRLENYNSISIAKILRSLAQNVTPIALAYISTNFINLLVGYLSGFIITYTTLIKKIFFKKENLKDISIEKSFSILKKYKVFPLYNAPSSFANTVTHQLPFIFIFYIGGEAMNGLYFLAARLISIPTTLIGVSFGQVFYRQIIFNINNKIKLMPLLNKSVRKLFFIAFPCFLLIFFLSPKLFPLILGNKWTQSGIIAQYLGCIFLIQFIVSTVSQVISIEKYVLRGAKWKYGYFFSSILFYSMSYFAKIDFYTFLLFLVIHEYILYSIYFYIILKSVKENDACL